VGRVEPQGHSGTKRECLRHEKLNYTNKVEKLSVLNIELNADSEASEAEVAENAFGIGE
jgi:hypothetical protein